MFPLNSGCGCLPIQDNRFEYEIQEVYTSPIIPSCSLKFGDCSYEEIQEEIICDFLEILNQLECGIRPDLNKVNLNIMKIESMNIAGNRCNGEFLKRRNYLSEFETEKEKRSAVENLGLFDTELLTENNYNVLEKDNKLKENTIYFIIPDETTEL